MTHDIDEMHSIKKFERKERSRTRLLRTIVQKIFGYELRLELIAINPQSRCNDVSRGAKEGGSSK